MASLQETLKSYFGSINISKTTIPPYITGNLTPEKPLRTYQKEALRYMLTYFENDFDGKDAQADLLFQMATGSGKTLLMAASILYLYRKGYRKFLFFVNTNNVIRKTKDNFTNPQSAKYLFADNIVIDGQNVSINMVDNFQHVSAKDINLCLTTVQQLHIDLTAPKEGGLTFDDFASSGTVLISDEAHHINASTRRGGKFTPGMEDATWENTVLHIFKSNDKNVLLEYTATSGMENNDKLTAKYENKLIFDYALGQYRKDGYSKEIETVQTCADLFDRSLCALVLSQFKLKLFESIGYDIKPVVMFKSKTIAESNSFFGIFRQRIRHLKEEDLLRIRSFASGDIQKAFSFFAAHGITQENLVLELREDFDEEKLILINQKNIDEHKQSMLNSLEDTENRIRCVFAVDMLNEGWDVLNLFDIVRLYETRDARNGKPGPTTIKEAQLIGRGARYMPFVCKNSAIAADKRKFDHDIDNPLRIIEKLHYHTAVGSRYIDELRKALTESGIIEDNMKTENIMLKPSFKETSLYKEGIVFANRRVPYKEPDTTDRFADTVLSHVFKVGLPGRRMRSDTIFEHVAASDVPTLKYSNVRLISMGKHVLRAALNANEDFRLSKIKAMFPAVGSMEEFVNSSKYLAGLSVDIICDYDSADKLTQQEKLIVARQVLRQLAPMIYKRYGTYIGSCDFMPYRFSDVFKDHHALRFSIGQNSGKETGVSMLTTSNSALRTDLSKCNWYAYNDCFGTSEEKYLIKYIESMMPKLQEKYSDVYLVRNEKDLKIFAFEDGSAFEPDFVLFMRHKVDGGKFDNIQIFIEPKGAHIEAADKWKADFLSRIGEDSVLTFSRHNDMFRIWGLPFYQEENKTIFAKAFKDSIII